MTTFFTLLAVAVLAYRVLIKGESIIVKNPNWKMRGLACMAMGLSTVAVSLYGVIILHLYHRPILIILWVLLATGIGITAIAARMLMRLYPWQ